MGVTILRPKSKVVERKPFALLKLLERWGLASAEFAQPRSGQGKGQSLLMGLGAWTKKAGHVNLHNRHSTKECAGVGCLIAPH